MNPIFFIFLYVALCALYLKRMRFSPEKPNRVIFKCIPLGMLFGATVNYLGDARVLSIKSPDFLPRVYALGGGLIFSVMSMAYSEFPSIAFYSLLTHAIAISTYIYGFSSGLALFLHLEGIEMAVGGFVFVLSILLMLYLVRNLRCVLTLLLACLSLIDATLVTTMSVLAIRAPIPPHLLGVVGSVLICASDVLQAVSKWKRAIHNAELIIMITYFVGQLLFSAAILLVVL